MKKKPWVLLAAALVLAFPACTNQQGETEASVFITVGLPAQPLIILVSSAAPVQITEIDLISHFKASGVTDPQGFSNIEVSYYTVEYFRRDGGTRVPQVQQFAVAGVLPSGGSLTLKNYPIMAASALSQSPFDQLLPFNGGVDRETGLTEIHVFYKLTFFGQTVSGQRVQSQTAIGEFFVQ